MEVSLEQFLFNQLSFEQQQKIIELMGQMKEDDTKIKKIYYANLYTQDIHSLNDWVNEHFNEVYNKIYELIDEINKIKR